ncbi:MAG TPA: hypothetical protein DHW82_04130, partial [Spirochaetia bacterium]|nr:hypothetical protein [Spirochaetia bacterium]
DIKPQTSGSNNASLVVLGYTTPTVNLNVQSFSDNNGGYAEATLNGTPVQVGFSKPNEEGSNEITYLAGEGIETVGTVPETYQTTYASNERELISIQDDGGTTLSSDALLSSLDLSAGSLSPVFSSSVIAYTAAVPNTVTSITLTPVKDHANAVLQMKVNSGTWESIESGTASRAVSLNEGVNTIAVKVTAENTTTVKTYTMVITREAGVVSTNANLSSLSLSGISLSPVFSNAQLSYTVSVANAVSSFSLTAVKENAAASIQMRVNSGNWIPVASGTPTSSVSLITGSNTIEVQVTAEDGTTVQTYTLAITRQAPSSDASLSSLGLSAGSYENMGDNHFEIIQPYAATTLTITPVTTSSYASVSYQGSGDNMPIPTNGLPINLNIESGEVPLDLIITAEDGTTVQTYTLLIYKEPAPVYTITYDPNGGQGSQIIEEYSTSPINLTPNSFTKSGYIFMGWSSTQGGAVEYSDNAIYSGGADITLYAVWDMAVTYWYDSWSASVTGGNVNYTATQSAIPDSSTQTLRLDYNNNGASGGSGVPTQIWTFTANASTSGTMYFNWHVSAYHMYSGAQFTLQFFYGATTVDLQPNITTNGWFELNSAAPFVVNLTQGQAYGFRVIGSNTDSNSILYGTVMIYGQVLPNLALGKEVASSSMEANFTPTYAVDGATTGSYWASLNDVTSPQWISINLGAVKTVTEIKLYWEAAATTYRIETSNDGTNWTVLGNTLTAGANYSTDTLTGLNVQTQYVRMSADGTKGTAGVALYEFEVYGY